MIQLKSNDQIKTLKLGGAYLHEIFLALNDYIKPGISTLDIDIFVENKMKSLKCIPAFKGYNGFPASVCTSVNDTVIHGIPDNTILKKGDIIGCDIGLIFNDLITDSCYTFAVPPIKKEVEKLLDVTEKSLYKGIEAVQLSGRIKDIGKSIQNYIEPYSYGIVHQFCGHGVGFEVHEDPQISNNYPSYGRNPRIRPGMVLAIEPMVNLGSADVEIMDDGWTVKTVDQSISAHFEHTIAVLEDRIEIITLQD